MNLYVQILVDNTMPEPLQSEHGLSLSITYGKEKILFDTGAGEALLKNLAAMGIDPADYTKLLLSHGHYDHTGGIADILPRIPQADVYFAPGITCRRFSRHADRPVKELTMPEKCQKALSMHKKCHEISSFTEIADGIFLTGPIPRISGEDCGGPFYLDADGKQKDLIVDEQALLFDCGVLIQGCCHAGIINTLEHCRKCMPQIRIHTVIGGLHLLLADENRLKQTGDFLRQSGIRRMFLMHCTGEKAIGFLRDALPECAIYTPVAGDVISL